MEEERKVVVLNIDDILPNRFQPRIKFSEHAINELAESIKLHGVIQPIVVRKISDKYEIIAGERRYKASVIAGKTTIPAIVTTLDDRNSAEVALIENVQRQDLTPIEEAISYKKILDMGYINQQELGAKLGKKQSTIANKLRLLNLNDEVQEALMENKISERHARSLLKLNSKLQTLMLNRIINERLTVRRTDEEIAKLLENSDNNEQKVNEKGDNMNNDILKDFNIPTEPIVNDNDSIVFEDFNSQSTSNVEPQTNQNIESTNNIEPLMNQPVESISNSEVINAQPIEPTPIAFNNELNREPIESINNINPEPINPGFMDVDKIKNEAQDIVTEPAPVANIDDLMKPDAAAPVMEQPVEMPTVTEDSPIQQGGKFFNFGFNNNENNDSFVENIEEEKVNMDFGLPTNNSVSQVAPADSLNVFGQNDVSVQNNIESSVQQPEINIQPDVQPTQVVDQTINNEPSLEFEMPQAPLSLNDDDEFGSLNNNNFNSESPIDYNKVNKPYMMDDDVKFDDEGEIEVQLPQQDENKTVVDMKTVINTIRECARTIESYGYKIDTDELDLADSYEVTFRIEKND